MTDDTPQNAHLPDSSVGSRNNGIVLEKRDVHLDRCYVYFKSHVSDQEYIDACVLTQAQMSAGVISRFSIRGIVGTELDEQKVISSLPSDGGVIELSKLPLDTARNFFWVSRNSPDRSLSLEALDRLVAEMSSNIGVQATDAASFQNAADELFNLIYARQQVFLPKLT